MKTTVLSILGSLTLVSLAHGYNGWGLHASYWSPSDGDDGFGGGGKVSIEMVPGVQLELRATYFDDLAEDPEGVNTDLEVVPLEAGLALTWPLEDPFELYAGGGVGGYFLDASANARGLGNIDLDPDNEFGFYLAGGAEAKIKENASLYAELKYTFVTADDIQVRLEESDRAFTLDDVDLDGIGFNVGVMIRW